MKFDIITLFPAMFDSYFGESIIKRAVQKKLITINLHNLRDYTLDKHNKVDDRPYGGGPGMLLQVEPIVRALKAILGLRVPQPDSRTVTPSKKSVTLRLSKGASKKLQATSYKLRTRVIMLTPAGKQFTQREAKRLAQYDQVVLLCGRYEGFDARVDSYIDEKISIGPYVLAGGELPAMIVLEAVARHIPNVLGHDEALADETFAHGDDYIEYPQYSRPEVFEKKRVPKVLLSGDHKKVAEWRASKAKTKK